MKKMYCGHVIYLMLAICLMQGQLVQSWSPKTESIYLYRVMNWCIIGKGEYQLNEWPFVQFRPFLRQDHRVRKFEDNNFVRDNVDFSNLFQKPTNMELQFKSINCDDTGYNPPVSPVTVTTPLVHHSITKTLGRGQSTTETQSLQRVHIQFTIEGLGGRSDGIEGLILQAVHAPFGLGLPFGQFDESSEFQCNDCTSMYSTIIGCISRPGGELMHPTVLAFHHDYKHPTNRGKPVGRRKEIHANFKWADSKCSSSHVVEFWALIVLSFGDKIWMTHKFGPYDLQAEDKIFMNIHQAEPLIGQPPLPTPIMPRCQKRKKISPLPAKEECLEPGNGSVGNCEAELKAAVLEELPSKMKCHNNDYGFLVRGSKPAGKPSTDTDVNKVTQWSKIRFTGSYDVSCVQKYPFKRPFKICPEWKAKYFCSGKPEELELNKEEILAVSASNNRLFSSSFCKPCVTLKPTPEAPDVDDSQGLIKRKPHTVLMIFAFFFVLPLSAFIGRFYKETLHTCEFKGWRLWLIVSFPFFILIANSIHSTSSVATLILCYASYSLVTFSNNLSKWDAHIWTGFAAVFCAAGGFVSGWGRHKQFHLKWISIILHLACGYSAYGFALASYATHKKTGYYSTMASWTSFGLSLTAMTVMGVHIFSVDRRLGVTPKRCQLPIIDIRFDEIFPPGHRFRIIFLGVYGVLLLAICCAMIFLE